MDMLLKSCICTQQQLESADFQIWYERIRETEYRMHRKIWEWCYIAQALHERGMLKKNRKGVGFAVGREPLVALFASLGCNIVASDLDEEGVKKSGADWIGTGQHATNIAVLNERGICEEQVFQHNTSFRIIDMNALPNDLRDFDFCWSSCAFEHLGSIEQGKQFIYNMLDCLKPGGIAVHTTEFNVSSNENTIDHLPVVLFRRCDIEEIAAEVSQRGCRIELDFTLGNKEADLFVDTPPYTHNPHLKFLFGPYISTSIGLIIQKGKE